jgi:hypothetical protein
MSKKSRVHARDYPYVLEFKITLNEDAKNKYISLMGFSPTNK